MKKLLLGAGTLVAAVTPVAAVVACGDSDTQKESFTYSSSNKVMALVNKGQSVQSVADKIFASLTTVQKGLYTGALITLIENVKGASLHVGNTSGGTLTAATILKDINDAISKEAAFTNCFTTA